MLTTSAFTRSISDFWQRHPALLYGLMGLWGVLLSLTPTLWPHFLLFIAIASLPAWVQPPPLDLLVRLGLGVLLAGTLFVFTQQTYSIPQSLPSPTPGVAVVQIDSVTTSSSPFGLRRLYKGVAQTFVGQNGLTARQLPLTLSLPKTAPTLPLDQLYQIEGQLRRSPQGKFSLSPDLTLTWKPLKPLWNLTEQRASAKSLVKQRIDKQLSSPHTAAFLSGIATGEFEDMQLSFELGRFGLQHLMAISGLHFSILAAMLATLFSFFFPKRGVAAATLIALSLYFLFLGYSPSVLRAWVAIALTMGAVFVQRRSLGLNSLGIALLAIALIDPLALFYIPFQFSFGVTASILIWYAPCDYFLQRLFQKRPLSTVAKMHWADQHGYCLLHFLRQGLALAIAVNLIALPLTLFHFQRFPAMSLIYNLFFPFLVSVSMLLLLLGLPLQWLAPPIGKALFWVNEHYTNFLLNFAFNLPRNFDHTWHLSSLEGEMVLLYAIVLYAVGVVVRVALPSSDSQLNQF